MLNSKTGGASRTTPIECIRILQSPKFSFSAFPLLSGQIYSSILRLKECSSHRIHPIITMPSLGVLPRSGAGSNIFWFFCFLFLFLFLFSFSVFFFIFCFPLMWRGLADGRLPGAVQRFKPSMEMALLPSIVHAHNNTRKRVWKEDMERGYGKNVVECEKDATSGSSLKKRRTYITHIGGLQRWADSSHSIWIEPFAVLSMYRVQAMSCLGQDNGEGEWVVDAMLCIITKRKLYTRISRQY